MIFIDDACSAVKWLTQNRQSRRPIIEKCALNKLDGWSFSLNDGLKHHSGNFFSIHGITVCNKRFVGERVTQPILLQPEEGILGFLRVKRSGNWYYLFQAKFEPGNPGLIQFAPTVQATVSNYTRVHGGKVAPFVEFFRDIEGVSKEKIAVKRYSETASRFYQKVNFNIIRNVETEDLYESNNHVFVNEHAIGELLATDNLLNMNARSVLSMRAPGSVAHKTPENLKIFMKDKYSEFSSVVKFVPLNECTNWECTDYSIEPIQKSSFRIFGLNVQADREVKTWSQPMVENLNVGDVILISRLFENVRKFLIKLDIEVGTVSGSYLSPTSFSLDPHSKTKFNVEYEREINSEESVFSVLHSEEGGRFYKSSNLYSLYYCDNMEMIIPDNFIWLSLDELQSFNETDVLLTSELRTFLSMLRYMNV